MPPTYPNGTPPHNHTITLILTCMHPYIYTFFFFNDTATTEIYTLSLHDALPIYVDFYEIHAAEKVTLKVPVHLVTRSEEHTSELQSQSNLVCRLLLEKKKTTIRTLTYP